MIYWVDLLKIYKNIQTWTLYAHLFQYITYSDGQILDIYENPDEYNPIPNFFEKLYLEFPTPFEKGNILWIPNYKGVFD